MEAGGKFHAPTALAQGRNPVLQSLSGRFAEEKKNLLPLVGFESQITQSLA